MGRIEEVVREIALSASGHHRIICPECSPQRRPVHRREATLSVEITRDRILWHCHHCAQHGGVPIRSERSIMSVVPSTAQVHELSPAATDWLRSRGITTDNPAIKELRMIGSGIAFPYTNAGIPYAYKIRSLAAKMFWCQGSPQTFYIANGHADEYPRRQTNDPHADKDRVHDYLVITEGEIDALSFAEAGITAWSVPHGALNPGSAGKVDPSEDRRLRCVWAAKDALERFSRIYIAADADAPGEALAEELARRLGKHKCWRVKYPEGCKDANDVLVKFGTDAIAQLINSAEPWPISGLHNAADFVAQVVDLYQKGMPRGEPTGWLNVDEFLSVKQGMLYVVTGIPSAGKSTWLDALMTNLAVARDWRIAFASFETQPISIHVAKLCAQYCGKPFIDRLGRMSLDEMHAAISFVNQHFLFCSLGEQPTVQSIIDRFKVAVIRQGVRAVVLDPYNFVRLAHKEGDGIDTEAVNEMLNEFKMFASGHDVAFFIVAHPAKPQNGNEEWVPKGYAISGSAHWYNRADIGITIHRARNDLAEVHIWKVRFNHLGKQGKAHLVHDVYTGRYCQAPTTMIPATEDFF